jgi:F0F1-type ATP synthase membrane subunit b/b'
MSHLTTDLRTPTTPTTKPTDAQVLRDVLTDLYVQKLGAFVSELGASAINNAEVIRALATELLGEFDWDVLARTSAGDFAVLERACDDLQAQLADAEQDLTDTRREADHYLNLANGRAIELQAVQAKLDKAEEWIAAQLKQTRQLSAPEERHAVAGVKTEPSAVAWQRARKAAADDAAIHAKHASAYIREALDAETAAASQGAWCDGVSGPTELTETTEPTAVEQADPNQAVVTAMFVLSLGDKPIGAYVTLADAFQHVKTKWNASTRFSQAGPDEWFCYAVPAGGSKLTLVRVPLCPPGTALVSMTDAAE